jgi:thiamine pyrophosphate-dependent acetolactate synthase large subunit-like protein
MNKLEKLKALSKEKDKWRLEWINAQNANDDDEVIRSYHAEYRRAIKALDIFKNELLPDLIAVAEAAKGIDWSNVCLKNYEERHLVNVLQDALLSLTKDADK